MSGVRMRHSDVENEIEVAESAVPFHAAAGWEVVEDDDRDTAESSGEADDSESGGEKTKSGRARPTAAPKKKEGQD